MEKTGGEVKNRMRKAGQSALRIALPMVAALMISCAPERAVEEQCDMHNSTTVTINRNEPEGRRRVAGIDELRVADGLISDELAYAIRACHNLASLNLPEDMPTTFTTLNEGCLINPETGYTATAYAITPYNDPREGDCGVYTHLHSMTLDDFSMMNHEIGHLQMPCGEFGAETNAAEQMLMLFAAYSNNGSVRDTNRWAAQATNQLYGLEALYDALRHIYQNNFRLDPDPVESMQIHPKWRYIRTDIHLFELLRRFEGDFSEIRNEITNMERSELQAAALESVNAFVVRYSGRGMQHSLGKILTEIRMAHYSELERRFGAGTANSYFMANSHSIYWLPETRDNVRVSGLGAMDCALTEWPEHNEPVECGDVCSGFGASDAVRMEGVHLRCFIIDGQMPAGFELLDVTADGTKYTLEGGQVRANSIYFNAIVVFDDIAMVPVEAE